MKKMYTFLAIIIAVMVCVEPVLAVTDLELAAKSKIKQIFENTTPTLPKPIFDGVKKENSINSTHSKYVEGEVLVKFKNNKIKLSTSAGKQAAKDFATAKSLERAEDFVTANISVLNIKDLKSVEEKIAELKKDPNVEYAEPNYRRYPAAIPTNDTHRGLLWGLDNIGQTVGGTHTTNNPGTADSDIDAPEAWAINEGTNAQVIVAVIDSGVAYKHPDLLLNMWNGTNCKDANGVLLGGCNHGYDYVDNDTSPHPVDIHGTHIAGTIAAVKNNAVGTVGVAPNAKIMAIRFGLDVASEVQAIDFAIQNGAKIINASFSGEIFSQTEYDAIQRFKNAGGIFVASAGNEATNSDTGAKSYPANYDLSNIISVAATDQTDALASFTNYGNTLVDVAAPGTNIYAPTASNTIFLQQTFEGVNTPNLPIGWLRGGVGNNWGTHDLLPGVTGGVVLYGDLNTPYLNNASTNVVASLNNISGLSFQTNAVVSFDTHCDTEYATTTWTDYMELYSTNGATSVRLAQWDEAVLDDNTNPNDDSPVVHAELSIPAEHLITGARLEFRWTTDESVNDFDGCWIDDVVINAFSDLGDGRYGYQNGTSAAAPFVSGIAALIAGYNPTLTADQIKNIIVTSGDTILSHAGKTVSGKRVNAHSALQSLIPSPEEDTTAPVITLNSSNPMNLNVGDVFTDPGATATDNVDGLVPVTPSGSVNTASAGVYTITYTATDAALNTATATRTVNVTAVIPGDTLAPVIGLSGSNPINLIVGDSYTEPGFTASDDVDGDLTSSVTVGGDPVDTNNPGSYTVTYNVTDAAGNPAIQKTRVINVSDVDGPVFSTVPGNQSIEATSGSGASFSYTLPTATDAVDGNVPVTCAPETNTTLALGAHTIECSASDTAGNDTSASFVATVEDTEGPVITLTGGATLNTLTDSPFIDPGATAIDVVDGNISASIIVTGTVDTGTIGAYTLTYSVTDATGNNTSEERVVNVSDLSLSAEQQSTVATNSATITWATSHPATSRVLFDTASHSDASTTEAGPVNYGYANSTSEDASFVTNHSVTVTGLSPATTYFFRPVSHGSPEMVGAEVTVTTNTVSSGGGGNGGGGGGSSSSRTSRYSVKINNDAKETTSNSVTLKITPVSRATQMQVSNTSNFAQAVWVPFQSNYPWTLTSGGGVKNVYVRYGGRNNAVLGNARDNITLVINATATLPVAQVTEPAGQVLGASTYHFAHDLFRGSSGNDVIELQKILIAGKYLKINPPTGYYGTMTETGVRWYQGDNRINQTGIVGAEMRALLNKESKPLMSTDQKTLLIKELQTKVLELIEQLKALEV